MRNYVIKVFSVALAGMAAFTAILPGQAPVAHAQSRYVANKASGPAAVHQSILQIRDSHQLPMTKAVTLARNKSLMIELPRDLRDVIVSNPEMIDAVVQTSNRVYLIGKTVGQANAFFFDSHGERILTLEVQVEVDTRPLDSLLRRFIPNSNIRTEVLNDTLILTGTVRNPVDSTKAAELAARFANTDKPQGAEAQKGKVINMLVVEGEEQVMLQVKIAEVQRSILKQFGINLGAAFQNANGAVNILTDNALPITTQQGLGSIGQAFVDTTTNLAGLALPQATGVANAVTNSGIAGVFAPGGGSRNISYTLKALERNGLVRTLAEPNLTAVSGESANFLAGGEFPIPVSEENGAISIAFKEFGVGLAFTPIVMSEGRISLKISTEVSELSTTGAVTLSSTSIPALTKRKTESTVELPSGGTLAISGLVSHSLQKNVDGFPGLKELPVLGTLFRSTDFANKETELVVIVTPYIVRPTSRKKLAAPTDGLVSATDVRTYLLGHLNRVHGRSIALPAGSTKDGIGFIVE
ncbi:MAG: type II and III secretion system protein family protein [Pseudomonadota bacterium]